MSTAQLIQSSPLLQRIDKTTVGEIYLSASKNNISDGFNLCSLNTFKRSRWNVAKTAIDVQFVEGVTTSFKIDGFRVMTKCDCRFWQPARNCPHVVLVWAAIKKILSPTTFPQSKFNANLLKDMTLYLNLDGDSNDLIADKLKPIKKEVSKVASTYRLLIEKSQYGEGITGCVRRGMERLQGWNAIGIPDDLNRFLAIYNYFTGTFNYIESFLKLTNNQYPIVFRHDNGKETILTLNQSKNCTPTISFNLTDDTIIISRALRNGAAISENALVCAGLLYDLDAGTIVQFSEFTIWQLWRDLYKQLAGEDNFYFDEPKEPSNSAQYKKEILQKGKHSFVVSKKHFINFVTRFSNDIFDAWISSFYFLVNGIPVDSGKFAEPSYLIDIPYGMDGQKVILIPRLEYDGEVLDFSTDATWYLNSASIARVSAPLKTKKRIKAILDGAFRLVDEKRGAERAKIMRSVTSNPDFAKREIKKEAKLLMQELDETWNKRNIIPLPTENGWSFIAEDCNKEMEVLRVLYNSFGFEPFVNVPFPGGMELKSELFIKYVQTLMESLKKLGMNLHIGSQPTEMANWEFTLDATSSSIDWFELKPEIRCNGETLSQKELQNLLNGNGMLQRDGKMMLMDDIAAQVLAMFSGTMTISNKKKKKGEQELVRVPRLQILDWLQLRKHGVEIKLAPEDSKLLENLLNFSSIPIRQLPANLNATLRHYQVDAWRWLAFMYEHRFGACLADDMGLGKTVQGITLLAGIMSGELQTVGVKDAPHLVVAPPSLLFNWEAEIARFLPTAKVLVYSGTARNCEKLADYDVVITSYGIVQRDADKLADYHFNVLIFDEAQTVKNIQAATTNAVRKLNGSFTLALTGTPVENHLGEYFAIMDLCLPGLLGTRDEFTRNLSKDGVNATTRLIGRTKPFVLRRTKQLIASELPPKIEIDIPLELSDRQKLFYQRTVEEVRGEVKNAYENHANAQARIIALTAILRLRQICLSPALASSTASNDSPKLDFLKEQLSELMEEGHSVLVFSQFTGYLDIVEKGLLKAGFKTLRLDGSTPVPHRKKLVQSFQNSDDPTVFLISLKAGGKGLNLTRATYVYHLDPWWNPAVENQASDRAHRIGQTEQVTITRLIMKHTIEEKMMTLKEQKTALYKAILEDGASGGGAGLTREDMEFLLQ